MQYRVIAKYSKNGIWCDHKLVKLNDFLSNLQEIDYQKMLDFKGDLCACQTNVHKQFAFVIGNIGFKLNDLNQSLHLPWNSVLRFGFWSCKLHANTVKEQTIMDRNVFYGNFWCSKRITKNENLEWNCARIGQVSLSLILKKYNSVINFEESLVIKGYEDVDAIENCFLGIGHFYLQGKELSEFVV